MDIEIQRSTGVNRVEKLVALDRPMATMELTDHPSAGHVQRGK